MERERAPDHRERGQSYITCLTGERGARLNEPNGVAAYRQKYVNDVTTLGFSDCGHHNYRPGRILDPFIGSGTTALVARKHGRHTIGIELSAEYAQLAARRTQQLSLEAALA